MLAKTACLFESVTIGLSVPFAFCPMRLKRAAVALQSKSLPNVLVQDTANGRKQTRGSMCKGMLDDAHFPTRAGGIKYVFGSPCNPKSDIREQRLLGAPTGLESD